MPRQPEVQDIIEHHDMWLYLTSVDYSLCEGTFKMFPTPEAALLWAHGIHQEKHPKWHALHCPTCRDARLNVPGETL